MNLVVAQQQLAANVQAPLQLLPALLGNLFTRAVPGLFAVQTSDVPIRNAHGQQATHLTVAVFRQVVVFPKLWLRDGGERPRRVDVGRVARHDWHVLGQIELNTVHPFDVLGELMQVLQRGVQREKARRQQPREALYRQREDEIVTLDARKSISMPDRYRLHRSAVAVDFANLRTPVAGDVKSLQMLHPRRNPHVVRWPIENAIEAD